MAKIFSLRDSVFSTGFFTKLKGTKAVSIDHNNNMYEDFWRRKDKTNHRLKTRMYMKKNVDESHLDMKDVMPNYHILCKREM